MDTIWIVTANAGRARIFSAASARAPVEEINDMINDVARLHTAAIDTDKLGQVAAGKSTQGTGAATPGSAYQPAQTPLQHETERFARSLAATLLQGHRDGRYGQLVLTASPAFLGTLRPLLDPQLTPLLRAEIDKDLTQASPAQLREQLHAALAPG